MRFENPSNFIKPYQEQEKEKQEEIKLAPETEKWLAFIAENDKERAELLRQIIIEDIKAQREIKKPNSPWQEYTKKIKEEIKEPEVASLLIAGTPFVAAAGAFLGYSLFGGSVEAATIGSATTVFFETSSLWGEGAAVAIKEFISKLKQRIEKRSQSKKEPQAKDEVK